MVPERDYVQLYGSLPEFQWQAARLGNYNKMKCFMADFGSEGASLQGRGIVSDPKGKKPESDQEEDLPLELHLDAGGAFRGRRRPAGERREHERLDRGVPLLRSCRGVGFHGTGQFHLSHGTGRGRIRPIGRVRPPPNPRESRAFSGPRAWGRNRAPRNRLFRKTPALSRTSQARGLPTSKQPKKEAKPKPKFQLPAWVRTVEWVLIGLLGVGAWRQSWSRCFG